MTQQSKRAFTYDQLTAGNCDFAGIAELAKAALLDDATFKRVEHLGRFFGRIGTEDGTEDYVSTVLSEDDLRRLWWDTADEGDKERPTRPLLEILLPPQDLVG
jgi:hypothetical protein